MTALLALPAIGGFALFALGIVVIYRASRVLNLAHGGMAIVPAYVVYALSQREIALPISILAGVLSGALLGLVVERFIIRPLKGQSLTTQTVGTVAAFGLILAITEKIFGTTPLPMPQIFPVGFIRIGLSGIGFGAVGVFVVMLVLAALMFALFRF
ncbi:MAG: hypothetical protein JOY80_13145, partial [Candidatus Dormibacteraeota bacterium]|nr:hypothetical protein [Candidatus Dormibacteraeota bacterium]